MTIGIGSEALLELSKMFCRQRTIFLGDVGHIASSVVHPQSFGLVALRKEDNVCFRAGTVRRKSAVRKPKHGVKIAVLRQNLENFSSLIREEPVVWHNNSSPPSRLYNPADILNKLN